METDEGLVALTQIERSTPAAVVAETLRSWVGRDGLQVNLAQPEAALAGSFEQAVLDLRGQALQFPLPLLLLLAQSRQASFGCITGAALLTKALLQGLLLLLPFRAAGAPSSR